MAVLGPHGDRVAGQAQNVDGGEGAEQGIGIGEGVAHGVHAAVVMAALPDDGLGKALGAHVGGLEEPLQGPEEVSAGGFRAGDVQQVEHFHPKLLFYLKE